VEEGSEGILAERTTLSAGNRELVRRGWTVGF
jgi:hypothetical protein